MTGVVNDASVKPAKPKGEFVWHYHDDEDEFFLVIKGRLLIKRRDLRLGPGEMTITGRVAVSQPGCLEV